MYVFLLILAAFVGLGEVERSYSVVGAKRGKRSHRLSLELYFIFKV